MLRFLCIMLFAIGLCGCTVEREEPVIPAPEVTVQPPDVTVNPPEVTVNPPEVTVQPPEVTVNPPTVTVQPPDVTVNPPTVNVQPPEVNVHLPPNPPPTADTTPPVILSGTVASGDVDVNPAVINANGFRFDFNEVVTGIIKLTDGNGVDLNWFSNVAGRTGQLIAFGRHELVNETTYIIEIVVADAAGNLTQEKRVFITATKE